MTAYRTAEVRWFTRGAVPASARSWFDGLGPDVEPETRTDRYLEPTSDALGVKVREGRVEAKRRTAALGRIDPEGVSAEAEAWAKWSFETPTALEDGAGWVDVEKTRWQRHEGGCALELSRVVVEGEPWWSVCLEATGPDDGARKVALEDGARRWLRGAPALAADRAMGYPAWLRRRGR